MANITRRFDNAMLKVWFNGSVTSCDLSEVVFMSRPENLITIGTKSGATYLLNCNNIKMIGIVDESPNKHADSQDGQAHSGATI
jgi:hypothetical protein